MSLYRLNLPPIELNGDFWINEVRYESKKFNYKNYHMNDVTVEKIKSIINKEIVSNSQVVYQEADHTFNNRIHKDISKWMIQYMIDDGGGILNSYGDKPNSINQRPGEWVLIDGHIDHSPTQITGIRKAISLKHKNDWTISEKRWIENIIK